MLLPGNAGNKPSAGRAAESLKGPEAESDGSLGISWRSMLSKRALIWSGVVVVTGIIISYTTPPPPKPIAKSDNEIARSTPTASSEERRKSSKSDESWQRPFEQRQPLPRTEEVTKGEKQKDAALSGKSLVETKRASAALKPAAPAVAAANPPHLPMEGAVKPEAKSAPPADAVAGSAAPSKKFGAAGLAEAADRKPGKGAPNDAEMANLSVAKADDASGVRSGGEGKDGQGTANRFARQEAQVATYVVNVSAGAVKKQVFDNLLTLAHVWPEGTQNATNLAQNAPADKAFARRAEQQGPAAQTAAPDLDKQAGKSNLGAGATPSAIPRSIVSQALPEQRGNQLNDAGNLQRQFIKRYQFDASPEQLAIILKQVGERPDCFLIVYGDGGNNSSGGASGGMLAERSVQTQQAKAGINGANLRRQDELKSQATSGPGRGAARVSKQHVIFILNVVDRLPPAANRDSQSQGAPTKP